MIPRAFPPAPGWSPDGPRIKNEIDYSRGPEKTWVYGALRVRDGQELTMTATSRNSDFYQQFLQLVEDANPVGDIYVITDNLSSHNSVSTRTWLEDHPRIRHVFIPVGACWLNLQEGWWRIFRKTALAGRSFGDRDHITHATEVATAQLLVCAVCCASCGCRAGARPVMAFADEDGPRVGLPFQRSGCQVVVSLVKAPGRPRRRPGLLPRRVL